jgi:hypothetical protein
MIFARKQGSFARRAATKKQHLSTIPREDSLAAFSRGSRHNIAKLLGFSFNQEPIAIPMRRPAGEWSLSDALAVKVRA